MINNSVSMLGVSEAILYSEAINQPYRIMVAEPRQPAPPQGFPVIYVLDGNAYFQSFQEAIRIQAVRPEITGVVPAIIVGIGYPDERDFVRERRFYDFTPFSHKPVLPKGNRREWPETGGAELFMKFLEDTVKPFIEKNYTIDSGQQTLFGHSLGGLFSLYVLFTKTDSFQNYIVGSPSIWWNNKMLLQELPSFLTFMDKKSEHVRVFMTVGSDERDFIVKDAEELNELLETHSKKNNLRINFLKASGENHLSVVHTTLSKALRYISEG